MKFPQQYAKADGWTHWIRPRVKNYRVACCDCNLVHRFQFRVTRKGDVKLRARRDEKQTKKLRSMTPTPARTICPECGHAAYGSNTLPTMTPAESESFREDMALNRPDPFATMTVDPEEAEG